ncbi:MAG: hypothetical protein AAFQ53_17985 [Bacteroidota bacterium]
MVGRGLSQLPLPVRLAVTLPVLGMLVFTNYTAFSNKRAFEAWQEEGHMQREPVHVEARARHVAPAAAHHDPDAYYPSEHREADDEGDTMVWTAMAIGGAGLSVMAGCFAIFSLFPTRPPPEDPAPPASPDNPFV